MEIFSCHETKMFRDMIKLELGTGLFQLFQPVLLFFQPFAGKEGEKHTMPDQPFLIAEGS